ncbi:DUF4352 domain-containing protein [Alkalicoccobacillus gibsonii]|uniref:DUF4352 domain-containing protein n=1 Tax=Alkalicoccobacillus gibsonii TaxID=79881 RepID=A0ABU9VE23_9BACI
MKHFLKVALLCTSTFAILISCSNEENSSEPSSVDEATSTSNEETGSSNSEGSGLTDRNESSDSLEEDDRVNLAAGDTEDQLDLAIGDMGTIETTIEHFTLTIQSIEFLNELKGETPERDQFVLADVTIENINDDTLDLEQAVDLLEVTTTLEGSGGGDFSHLYEVDQPLSGDVQPGESVSGQLVFLANDSEEYYIRVNPGLISSSAVKNQVIWTFTEEDSE